MRDVRFDEWLVTPEERPAAKLRLLCLPPAGASSSLYRQWPASLPSGIEVLGVELPGRERRFREPPISVLTELLDILVPLVGEVAERGPFAVFGHSMGAVISFELIRRLRREGARLPELFCISGRKAPQTPERFPLMHKYSEAEFVGGLRAYGGTPAAVLADAELMEIFVPLLRADFTLFETHPYVPEAPLPVPFVVFGGTEDERANADELQAWRVHTSEDFRLHMIPGGHFFVRDNVAALLPILRAELLALLG